VVEKSRHTRPRLYPEFWAEPVHHPIGAFGLRQSEPPLNRAFRLSPSGPGRAANSGRSHPLACGPCSRTFSTRCAVLDRKRALGPRRPCSKPRAVRPRTEISHPPRLRIGSLAGSGVSTPIWTTYFRPRPKPLTQWRSPAGPRSSAKGRAHPCSGNTQPRTSPKSLIRNAVDWARPSRLECNPSHLRSPSNDVVSYPSMWPCSRLSGLAASVRKNVASPPLRKGTLPDVATNPRSPNVCEVSVRSSPGLHDGQRARAQV
jgi:hypothetical protein